MNCRGDDDIDANRSRPSIGKTRYVPREERTRAIVWNPITGLHQGQRPKRPHSQAEYMAAPERFAERSDFSLAPRAPSIHGTLRQFAAPQNLSPIGLTTDKRLRWAWISRQRLTQQRPWLCTAAMVLMPCSALSKYSFEPLRCSLLS